MKTYKRLYQNTEQRLLKNIKDLTVKFERPSDTIILPSCLKHSTNYLVVTFYNECIKGLGQFNTFNEEAPILFEVMSCCQEPLMVYPTRIVTKLLVLLTNKIIKKSWLGAVLPVQIKTWQGDSSVDRVTGQVSGDIPDFVFKYNTNGLGYVEIRIEDYV
ncbi:hypothetical protein BDF21DRAFT_394086 [Thamnidium elegans]|nr:hypothetical protein BDF21DRAFT_394086 [Thamnidium elegans]